MTPVHTSVPAGTNSAGTKLAIGSSAGAVAPTTLPPLRYAERVARCLAALDGLGCDAFVVTKLAHVRYLTGFTGSNGLLAVGAGKPVLVTDGRYQVQAADQLAGAGVADLVELRVESVAVKDVVTDALAGCERVGLEAASVTWAQQRRYAEDWFAGRELVATEGLVEGWRAVKEEGEVARIEAAAAIADAALVGVIGRLDDGPTEAEFSLELEVAMRRLGAEAPAFDTIIAAGPNGALPHARPGRRPIAAGDLVVIDFGAMVEGYRSDMTRTVCVGEPSALQQRMFDVVRAAQAAGKDAVRADVETKAVDAAARAVIEQAGWAEQFNHGTGHGIGLEVHEAPAVSRTATDTLRSGYVVTVEPGVYLEGVGGVRIEDTVVVSADGCRSLTQFPKSLAI